MFRPRLFSTSTQRSCLNGPLLFLFIVSTMAMTRFSAAATQEDIRQDKSQQQSLDESQQWYGTLTVPQTRQFRFYLKFSNQETGWSGTLKSLDEGERTFDMSKVTLDDQQLKFRLPLTAANYSGQWDPDSKTMIGQWKQRGQTFELNFHRVDSCPAPEIKAVWKGTINAIIRKLDLAFVQHASGEWFFESVSQKAGGFFAVEENEGDQVVLRVPGVQGTFKGTYSEDGDTISGKWSQGLASFDLTLKRSEANALKSAEPARPQMPKPPFPYLSEEVRFASRQAGIELVGTLTLPQQPKAAVLLVSGSGPQDRDETLQDHKPFLVIADHFARHGIATLRYDDRGTGESSGTFNTGTTLDFADDAEGGIQYLSQHADLAGLSIGISGHSEGGIIGPVVAARNKRLGFVILMGGTGVNGQEILKRQTRLILEAEGADAETLAWQTKLQEILVTLVAAHPEAPAVEMEAMILEQFQKADVSGAPEEKQLKLQITAGVQQLNNPWFRTFLTLDPTDYLRKVACPVLVIAGEKDLQVDPQQNLGPIRDALKHAPTKDFQIVEFPGLNHLFQACQTGSVSEYQSIEETFNPKALQTMTDWILEHATSGGTSDAP